MNLHFCSFQILCLADCYVNSLNKINAAINLNENDNVAVERESLFKFDRIGIRNLYPDKIEFAVSKVLKIDNCTV